MEQHLFSIDEVNALIPKLEFVMGRLQQRGAELRRGIEALALETGKPTAELNGSEIVELRPALRPLIEDLERLVGEIEECGGQFKGLDLGLVDFPAEINGEIALLCWQFGEKEVGYWHSLEGGFEGRQPLPRRQPRSTLLQ
ncbi:MAG TPA: DUF2203 domain-containing protein [Candidatus Kryptonia bacterium]|nr:DUF2203 domain-containing protein [Candidatus Kryptonia bacterium]